MRPEEQKNVTLVVRQMVRATPMKVFAAWTEPDHLKEWWGPEGVECIEAELELKVGGSYRIGNLFPDGKVLWITGVFELIEPPHRLRYTWGLESAADATERVTVRFEARGDSTEVIVTHEHIPTTAMRDMHQHGWQGCLQGLEAYLIAG